MAKASKEMTHVQSMWTASEIYPRLDDVKPEDVERLKQWCCNESDKIPQGLNDEQLILFLHACYNVFEDTQKCMIAYYYLRKKGKKLFQKRDINLPEIQTTLKVLNFGIIKPKTPEGYKIIFHNLNISDPSKYSFNDGFKLLTMAIDAVYIRNGPGPGVYLLFDLTGVKLGHVARLPLSSIKKGMEYIQDANPIRLKGIHVINSHPIIDKIMALVKPFLRKHLLSLLHFHKENDETVFEKIPKECMPSNFGGSYLSVEEMQREFIAEMYNLHPLYAQEDRTLDLAYKSLGKGLPDEPDVELSTLEID